MNILNNSFQFVLIHVSFSWITNYVEAIYYVFIEYDKQNIGKHFKCNSDKKLFIVLYLYLKEQRCQIYISGLAHLRIIFFVGVSFLVMNLDT